MTAPSGAVIPLSMLKINGRASALCGMAVEASRRPTINIVPRRITLTLRGDWSPHDGDGSDGTTTPGNTGFLPFSIRVQDWPASFGLKAAPPEGKPCVLKRFP